MQIPYANRNARKIMNGIDRKIVKTYLTRYFFSDVRLDRRNYIFLIYFDIDKGSGQ